MEHDEKLKVIEKMRMYGGSFVKALAEAILHADPINLTKLENAFPDLIGDYH